MQCNTMQYNTMQCNAMQYNAIQYNAMQYNTIQYKTIQDKTRQYKTRQYNTMQYNAMQYNTIQHQHGNYRRQHSFTRSLTDSHIEMDVFWGEGPSPQGRPSPLEAMMHFGGEGPNSFPF